MSPLQQRKDELKAFIEARNKATLGVWKEEMPHFLNGDEMFFAVGPSATDTEARADQRFINLAANKAARIAEDLHFVITEIEESIAYLDKNEKTFLIGVSVSNTLKQMLSKLTKAE